MLQQTSFKPCNHVPVKQCLM